MPRWTIVLCVRVCVWGSAGDPVCGLSSPIRYAVATWGNSFSIRRSKLAKKKKCFYDFGVFTVGCNVENEADTIASGHGMLLRAPRSISIIVRHFQLAIQIYHHSLSLSPSHSPSATRWDYYSSNSSRIDTFSCSKRCKADFVELQEVAPGFLFLSPPPLSYSIPTLTN